MESFIYIFGYIIAFYLLFKMIEWLILKVYPSIKNEPYFKPLIALFTLIAVLFYFLYIGRNIKQ